MRIPRESRQQTNKNVGQSLVESRVRTKVAGGFRRSTSRAQRAGLIRELGARRRNRRKPSAGAGREARWRWSIRCLQARSHRAPGAGGRCPKRLPRKTRLQPARGSAPVMHCPSGGCLRSELQEKAVAFPRFVGKFACRSPGSWWRFPVASRDEEVPPPMREIPRANCLRRILRAAVPLRSGHVAGAEPPRAPCLNRVGKNYP